MRKFSKADVNPIRQRTQFSCMAASLSMALKANGSDYDEDTVNKVMGAKPMRGASWEQALAAAQHFGMRGTLIVPCAMSQLREWTDRGIPVMIAWNPEGRDWSHASTVFDVTDAYVHIADPNIPDPSETVRIVTREDFLKKWFEKWPDYLVRRPALAIEPEITIDGRQVSASTKLAGPANPRPKKWSQGRYIVEFVTRRGETWWMGDNWKHSMDFRGDRGDEPKLFPSEAAAKRAIETEVIPYILRWQSGYEDYIREWDWKSYARKASARKVASRFLGTR